MESSEDYEYDVAFSFCQEDESLALKLSGLLHTTLNVFIYPYKQRELAFKDGEEEFHNVFSQKSRSVVVLYREKWGNKGWTAVEQRGINERGFEKGYDFVFMIPIEKPFKRPKWFSVNRIYLDLERFDYKKTASLIEGRVEDLGGALTEETLEEQAKKLKKEITFRDEKELFFISYDGVDAGDTEAKKVLEFALKKALSVADPDIGLVFDNSENIAQPHYCFRQLTCKNIRIRFTWHRRVRNTLNDSALTVTLEKANRRDEPSIISNKSYTFDISYPDIYGWSNEDKSDFKTSEVLVDYWLKEMLNRLKSTL